MSGTFEGYYFKHQNQSQTVAFIVGRSEDGPFVQVIGDFGSEVYWFDSIYMGEEIIIGDNRFGPNGICVNLPDICGQIHYQNTTPLKYNLMGPFSKIPMQCSHTVISMHHQLTGSLKVKGQTIDFKNGVGYIEGDSGNSFPSWYLWLHANHFHEKISIMAAVAGIPTLGVTWRGCLCSIVHGGKQYRLASFLGARAKIATPHTLLITQGRYTFIAHIQSGQAFDLNAPSDGVMSRIIAETNRATVRFMLYCGERQIFDVQDDLVSFEYSK